MNQPASYNDYHSTDILLQDDGKAVIRNYTGNGGPVLMDTEGVVINEILMSDGEYDRKLDQDRIYNYYLVEGELSLNDEQVGEDDFVMVQDEEQLKIETKSNIRLFEISVPKKLSYKTYIELVK